MKDPTMIERLLRIYNPDRDTATDNVGQPIDVSWADHALAIECQRLRAKLEDAEAQIASLTDWCALLSKAIRQLNE